MKGYKINKTLFDFLCTKVNKQKMEEEQCFLKTFN